MANDNRNGNGSGEQGQLSRSERTVGSWELKKGLAQMLKGGVIMDVVTPEQAAIAEEAGAVSVMALERVPADIRKQGGVARMSDPAMITGIIGCTTIPVMAKARIGHFVEAKILEALGVDYIDESEVLMKSITSTSTTSQCRLCVVRATWVRRCGASTRVRR